MSMSDELFPPRKQKQVRPEDSVNEVLDTMAAVGWDLRSAMKSESEQLTMPEEKITWELLQQLGLSITPHSDPAHGWGYTWQNRDWVGPFTTPGAALHAAFTEALLALQLRSAASFTQ